MTTREALKEIMASRNFNNAILAEKLGYKYASGISERLRSDMRISVLLRMLDAMGCELVVKSKLSDKGQWVIDGKENTISSAELDKLLNTDSCKTKK